MNHLHAGTLDVHGAHLSGWSTVGFCAPEMSVRSACESALFLNLVLSRAGGHATDSLYSLLWVEAADIERAVCR